MLQSGCKHILRSGLQLGPREITEEYDESLHGALNAPCVPNRVNAERQRFGAPRNAAEAAAQEEDMRRLREFVQRNAAAADGDSPAELDNAPAASSPAVDKAGTASGARADSTSTSHDPFVEAPDSDDDEAPAASAAEGSAQPTDASASGAPRLGAPAKDGGIVNEVALETELARLEAAFGDAGDGVEQGATRCAAARSGQAPAPELPAVVECLQRGAD